MIEKLALFMKYRNDWAAGRVNPAPNIWVRNGDMIWSQEEQYVLSKFFTPTYTTSMFRIISIRQILDTSEFYEYMPHLVWEKTDKCHIICSQGFTVRYILENCFVELERIKWFFLNLISK